jgi:uncharacterized membrane protein
MAVQVSPDLVDAANFFKQVLAVVLALALGEAFKQCVHDKKIGQEQVVRWHNLPSLVSFLALIIPFFHGMNRGFYITYIAPRIQPQANWLMIDGFVFLIELAIFFGMSRALSADRWKLYFYWALTLMAIDTPWCIYIYFAHRGDSALIWIFWNLVLALIFIGTLFAPGKWTKPYGPACIGAATCVFTTVASYIQLWEFYFP